MKKFLLLALGLSLVALFTQDTWATPIGGAGHENGGAISGDLNVTGELTVIGKSSINYMNILSGTGTDVCIGYEACNVKPNTGNSNVCIGYHCGYRTTESSFDENVFIGFNVAQGAAVGGDNNVGVGTSAFYALTTGANSTCVGSKCLNSVTTGSSILSLGYDTDATIDTSSNEMMLGYNCSGAACTIYADTSTDVVTLPGDLIVTGDIAVTGFVSGSAIHSTDNFNIDGVPVLEYQDGTDAFCLGGACTDGALYGVENICVGDNACANADTDYAYIASSFCAGVNACQLLDSTMALGGLSENVCIGDDSCVTASTGVGTIQKNVCVGVNSCSGAGTTAVKNVGVGYGSLGTISSGDNNTAVGHGSLDTTASGHDNIGIGIGVGTSSSSNNYRLMIGNFCLDAACTIYADLSTDAVTFPGDVTITGDLTATTLAIKSYSHSTGPLGTHWLAGFYDSESAAAELTQASTTTTYGTAGEAKAAHAFLVAAGAGTADTGTVTIVASGISITDAGVKTGADSEVIVADVTAMSTNDYYETSKKWLGVVTYTLTGTGNYTATFNYGDAKYEDFGNTDFVVTGFECVGVAGGNESDFNLELLHHSDSGWTYSLAGFIPGGDEIVSLATDHGTDGDNLTSDLDFAYKRNPLSTAVSGSASEGVVIRMTTTAQNVIDAIDCHIGVMR